MLILRTILNSERKIRREIDTTVFMAIKRKCSARSQPKEKHIYANRFFLMFLVLSHNVL